MPSAAEWMRAAARRGARPSRAVKRGARSAVQCLRCRRKSHSSKRLRDGRLSEPKHRAGGRPTMLGTFTMPGTQNHT